MVRRALVATIVFAFIILPDAGISYAQEKSFIVNGGISKALGDGSEYWNTGFSVGGNGFYPVSPYSSTIFFSDNILLGGRVAYNRWTPNEEELTKEYVGSGIDWDISGSATIIEIVPSIRILAPTAETQSVNFFSQLGLGCFLMNLDATVKGSYMGYTVEVNVEDTENKPGLSLGGGLTIGKKGSTRFEILPLYHIIFTEDETTKYFSVSAGVVF